MTGPEIGRGPEGSGGQAPDAEPTREPERSGGQAPAESGSPGAQPGAATGQAPDAEPTRGPEGSGGQAPAESASPGAQPGAATGQAPDAEPTRAPSTDPGTGPGPAPDPDTPAAPPHHLRYAARTHPGLIRANNEDALFAGDRILVVADGMGGHAAGEVASRLVVDALAPLNDAPPHPDLTVDLAAAVTAGNRAIADLVTAHPHLDGMGTTVSALLVDGPRAAIAHVGDSRIYLYRSGVLHQLTHDDTFVQSLVDEGRITEAQAHEHPQRNLVLRALTGIPVQPLLMIREVQSGDRFLLCSDGLCGVVDAESIADALAHPDPHSAVDVLIGLALAAGGPDNVTAIVADVTSTGESAPPAPAEAADTDPSSTNPIMRLTRQMPRVPLPPIPEEPAAAADLVGDEYGPDDFEDDDFDGDDFDGDGDENDIYDAAAADLPAAPVGGPAAASGDSEAGKARAAGARARGGRPRSARRRWLRRGIALIITVAVLGGLITAATAWVRSQYYVAEQGNVVVIFRGVDGSVLGWRLSTFEETSCAGATDCTPMKVSDLEPSAQSQVRAGIKAPSRRAAREVVRRLTTQLLPICPDPLLPADSPEQDETSAPASAPADSPSGSPTDSPAPPDSLVPAATLSPATTIAVPGVTCRIAP